MAETLLTHQEQLATELLKPRIKCVAQWIWAFMAVIGALVFVVAVLNTYRMLTCGAWPVTDGMIAHSELKRGFMREGALKFQLHLVYHYRVDGKAYESKRIAFGGQAKKLKEIRTLLTTYPKGRKVQVHYLPTHPKVATLETHVSWHGLKTLAGGLLLLCIGLVGIQRRWSLQTDYLFKDLDPDRHIPKWKIAVGLVGLTACLGLFWLWWELIKMYAGR
jgi:hypothetical protein